MTSLRNCSLPFNGTPNVTYGWGRDMTRNKFGCVWTTKNFNSSKEPSGHSIETPNLGGHAEDTKKWRLLLYPKGMAERNADTVIVCLKHCPDQESVQVSAAYKFSVINKDREQHCTMKSMHTFQEGQRAIRYFLPRDRLLDERNGLMQNNELVVYCEVEIFTQLKNSDGRYNCVIAEDSRCRVSADLGRLLESKCLTDVAIVAEDKELDAHKAILAARSPVFSAMFEHHTEEKQKNSVVISDISFGVLEELVRFSYTGKTPDIDEKMTMDLLAAADKYGFEDLKLMCEQSLALKLSPNNVADLVNLASLHGADHLTNQLVKFMKSGASDSAIDRLLKDMISQHPEVVASVFKDCQ